VVVKMGFKATIISYVSLSQTVYQVKGKKGVERTRENVIRINWINFPNGSFGNSGKSEKNFKPEQH
jgi:hypothetical protein